MQSIPHVGTPCNHKIQHWTSAKLAASAVADKLLSVAPKAERPKYIQGRAQRMADCCDTVEYAYCPACGTMHLARSNNCRDRLCPLCAWRLSIKRTANMMQVIEHMHAGGVPINAAMLTLTVKNCGLKMLSGELTRLNEAWHTLTKRRILTRTVLGYCRSLEVTRGKDGASLHPHMHVLLMMPQEYTAEIPQRQWAEMWQQSLRTDYVPIVDIRKAYAGEKASGVAEWQKAVAGTIEALKYMVKPGTLEKASPSDLLEISQAIHGARAVSYGGAIAQARRVLKLPSDDALAENEGFNLSCPDCGVSGSVLLAYRWAANTYQLLK